MKAYLILLFLLLGAAPALAEEQASLYQVVDVPADVTADSASHARNQAVIQAQRNAFALLMGRLNVEGKAAEANDEAIAALVQAFEVQQEKASAVRYIGTFTVQFKPNAVRAFLNKQGAHFNEARSKPLLVLPIVSVGGRAVLWEGQTLWRTVWEEAAKGASTVPLFLPPLTAEDAALLKTDEALAGKTEALVTLMRRYQAGGALVAVIYADPDHLELQKPVEMAFVRYDFFGKPGEPVKLAPAGPASAAGAKDLLAQVVRQMRGAAEQNFQQSGSGAKGPAVHLPVVAPIQTLAGWNALRRKLDNVPAIRKTAVTTLTRYEARLDLEFHGTPADLAEPLAVEGLKLEQVGNLWTLFEIGGMTP